MRVLLVEDDEALSQAVCGYLRAKAFVVDAVPSLAQAGAALHAAQYAAVLLDLHLTDGDGLSLLPQLRGLKERPIVIVLTARDQVSDRIPQIIKLADENPEGFTVDIYGNKYEGTGYSVGFQELSPEDIEAKLKAYRKAMEAFYVGGWKDDENYVLDFTVIVQSYSLAMTKARKYRQKAIYDFNKSEVITL